MTDIRRFLLATAAALLVAGAANAQAYRLYVSNEYDADISVIDPATATETGTIRISGRPGDVRPRGMAVSPDGGTIYVSVSDFLPRTETPEDAITAIDVATDAVKRTYRAGGNPERVAISPDGKQIWAALEATAQGVGIDAETGDQLGICPTGVETEGVAVSPDGKFVYVTAETSHTVTVIDTEGMSVVTHLLVGNRPRAVVFAPDGKRAYVTAEIGGTVSVIDVGSHEVVGTVNLGLDSRPVELVMSPDGRTLYVAGGGTSAVYVIDTATDEVTTVIKERMGRRPWGIAISPDGSRLYTANGLSDSVSVIDTASNEVVGQIAAGRGAHSVVVGRLDAS